MSDRPIQIPIEHWKPLGEISDIEMGQSPPSTYVFEGLDDGLPFLQGNAEFGVPYPKPKYSCAAPAKVGKQGSVLISVRAPVGAVNLADQDYCIGRGLAAIFPKRFPETFVAATVAKRSGELARVSQGTTFDAIGKRELHNLRVFAPDTPVAEKIAEILDTLDAAIRGTEAVVAKLRAMKQGLLHDLLTRGIDANGDLRPPQPEAPHLYKQTALGWLPKEWDALRIVDIADVRTGKTPPAEDPLAWGEHTPFVTPGDVTHGFAIEQCERKLSLRGRKYVPNVPAGSTLVVCIGSTIGKVGYVCEESSFNQQINAVVPNPGYETGFVFQSICKSIYQLHRLAGLQAVPIVNKGEFQKIRVPVAPKDEQIEIIARLSQIEVREAAEITKLEKLRATKSGLMDDLLTGRTPVTALL